MLFQVIENVLEGNHRLTSSFVEGREIGSVLGKGETHSFVYKLG